MMDTIYLMISTLNIKTPVLSGTEVITKHSKSLMIEASLDISDDGFKEIVTNIIKDHPDQWIISLKQSEILNYAIIHSPNTEYIEIYYYNDFDDYEDEVEFGTLRWLEVYANKYLKQLDIEAFKNIL